MVAFDLDGTLYDPSEVARLAAEETTRSLNGKYGLSLPAPTFEQVRAQVGQPPEKYSRGLFPDLKSELCREAIESIASAEGRFVARRIGSLYAGVLETLTELRRRGFRTALVSNCTRGYFDPVIAVEGLEKFFDQALCADDLKTGDKADLLEEVLRREKLLPEELLMVGDRSSDRKAAEKAGSAFAASLWGFGRPEEVADAEVRLARIEDLLALLGSDDRQ